MLLFGSSLVGRKGVEECKLSPMSCWSANGKNMLETDSAELRTLVDLSESRNWLGKSLRSVQESSCRSFMVYNVMLLSLFWDFDK